APFPYTTLFRSQSFACRFAFRASAGRFVFSTRHGRHRGPTFASTTGGRFGAVAMVRGPFVGEVREACNSKPWSLGMPSESSFPWQCARIGEPAGECVCVVHG